MLQLPAIFSVTIRERLSGWREPAWKLKPLSLMGWRYRAWMAGACAGQLLLMGWLFAAGGLDLRPDAFFALAVVVLTVLVAGSPLRDSEELGWDPTDAMAAALVLSGHVVEGLLCIWVARIVAAIRKPIVPHLLVANLIGTAAGLMTLASVLAMAGASETISLQWLVAGVAGYALASILDLPCLYATAKVGGYIPSWRDAWTAWGSSFTATMRGAAPIALVVGAVIGDSLWHAALLLVPYVVSVEVFKRSEKLVETQEESRASLAHEARKLARANLQFAAAMVRALDARDAYTAGHSAAVAVYARDIAKESGADDEFVRTAHLAGLLHDIGKIGVPGRILNKDRALTDEEYELMKDHSAIGAKILAEVDSYSEMSMFVRYHHERIDGRGYPEGIPGELIPAISRIIAVADTYSAMTTDRPYRDGMPTAKAMGILKEVAGTQLDALYVESFLRVLERESESYQRGKLAGFEVEVAKHEALSHAEEHVIEIAGEPKRDGIAATAAELQRIADEAAAAASQQQAMGQQRAPQLTRPASESDTAAKADTVADGTGEGSAQGQRLPDNVVEHPTAHRKTA